MSFVDSIASRFGYVRKRKPKGYAMRSGTSGFSSAQESRLFADWTVSEQSIDSILTTQLRTLRARARNILRNDDYARKFIHLLKNNVCGADGFSLQMNVLDANGSQDVVACDMIERAWTEFSMPENFTVTGTMSRADVEQVLIETVARDGEFIIRKVPGFNNKFRFAIQLIEPDYLDHDFNEIKPDGTEIRMGVEFDSWKKPIAYHFHTRNPNDNYRFSGYSAKRIRIPASEIIHGFVRLSGEQSRGCTWLATSMGRIKMLNGFEEAALVAARIGASKMGFFKPTPDSNGQYPGDGEDESGNVIDEVAPGEFRKLPNGLDFIPFDPTYPHTEHSAFTKAILRGVSSGLGVSYNSIASDLEGVNFSSIRAGLLEERDYYRRLQGWMIGSFHMNIFPEWLKMSLLSRAIPLPSGKLDKFNVPTFNGRRWQWVDPLKDQEANVAALRAKLVTPQSIIEQQGGDFEESMRQWERAREIASKYGVDIDEGLTPQLIKQVDDLSKKDNVQKE